MTLAAGLPRAFPGATCGADVVPGRPERVGQVADQLQEMSDGLLTLVALLRSLHRVAWHGVAQRAMAALVQADAEPLARAGALMAQSADHLRCHARTLTSAQQRADDGVRLDARVPAAPGPVEAAALRRVAEQEVAAARALVRLSALQAADGLAAAAALAPGRPGWFGRQAAEARGRQRQLAVGAVESQIDLLALAVRFSGLRLSVDPVGFARDAGSTAGASFAQLAHPRQLASDVLDLDTWRVSRERWAGHLATSLAVGAVPGATGLAAGARGVTVPARLLAAAPTPRGAALRLAIRDRGSTGRSPLRASDVRRWASQPSPLGTISRLDAVPRAVSAATARDATWAERLLTPRVATVADRVGALRVGADHVLKSPVSLHRKLGDELAAAGGASPGRVAARVNDAVRYTLVLPDESYVAGTLRTVEGLRREGLDLATAKSTWGGGRYQGVNLTLRDPVTGRLLEVQVHTAQSWAATRATHEAYELYRDAGVDPVLKAHLEREIGAQYAAVPRPPGVQGLRAALDAMGTDVPAVSGRGSLPHHDPWAAVRTGVPAAVLPRVPQDEGR